MGESRASLIGRIREVLERSGSSVCPQPPEVDESIVRLIGPTDERPELFRERATLAGASVYGCAVEETAATTCRVLHEQCLRRAVLGIADETLRNGLHAALSREPVELLDHRSAPGLEAQYDADVSISDVDLAIAESGTIVVSSSGTRSRGIFLVAPIHIALVRESQIVPDLIDALDDITTHDRLAASSGVVMVTGPSKTADIEGVLVTGAHGPRELHIVLINDDPYRRAERPECAI
jgi:L-lactate dehydrogenase complex protein LldG